MTWVLAGTGALSLVSWFLLWVERGRRKAAEKSAAQDRRELVAEREHAADLRVVVANKEREIAELEALVAEVSPGKLLDRIFAGVS